jgi:polyphosphate kinase
MTEFRCELLSADQLALLANGPLPSGIAAGEPRRSLHRDLYLDTTDDSLRRRGITCRLRIDAEGRALLTLRIGGAGERRVTRVDAPVQATDPAQALASDNAVARRIRGIIDPALLGVRVDLEVDRLTRRAALDWLRRPRLTVHLDRVTIRRNGTSAKFFQMCAHHLRGKSDELRLLEQGIEELHGVRASAVPTHERAELAIKWARLEDLPRTVGYSDRLYRAPITSTSASAEFINPELSLLAFQQRVLALADDARTPLRERLRFLAIVASNIDEFFMVRMASLLAAARDAATEAGDGGFTPDEELAAVGEAVAAIMAHQASSFAECRSALAARGVHVRTWAKLTAAQRETLRERFRDDILPLLTPMAMTLSPGHPLPRLGHLTLSIALILRSRSGGPPRFAELELPPSLPRFLVAAEGAERVVVPAEEIIRGNLDTLYPEMNVEHAYLFRVTRSAELELDEEHADDLLDEVARASATRGQGAAVRLEVERGMPAILRALLLENVRREQAAAGAPVLSDVEAVDGAIDLRSLTQLPLPDDPSTVYRPIEARRPFAASASVFETIARGEVLVHHPFDSFSDTVVRFIREASTDPDVQAIKITLYRVGEPSPIVDALVEAARRGKSVTAFVELKARFDEAVNVGLARALEAAGGHVVRGIVGLKNHAKVALVVRREGGTARRYVHIGTGNYNIRSGEQYTDLSLFTADSTLAGDVADLFNELTGASEAPRHASSRLLVAPHHLLPGILEAIDREAAHARAGRPARITAKFNGLSDPDAVRALYRASADGVEIDLLVRGICTLRPGVPGMSDRIRVVSVVGRFLEHSRVYRFENSGDPRYYIGSADLRPRNLRRRVELLAPIASAEHRKMLDRVLSLYLNDPSGWELRPDGSYVRRPAGGLSAQTVLANANWSSPVMAASPLP